MLKKIIDLTSHEAKGLNTNPNIFTLTKDHSPNMMNVKVEHDGSWMKRLGTITMNTVIITDSAASGFSPTGAITNSLIAFWKMDEPSGNRADSYGGHTLLDNNTVLNASGIRNKAALFVSSNSEYLLHANTSTLATGDVEFGMSAWFYLNSTSTTLERTIISKRDDSLDTDVVLLLHCDGADGSTTFTDNSLSGKSITANGNAQIDTSQSVFGGASGLFDGSGDYLTAGDSADWDFGTGDFTIEFRIRHAEVINSQAYISHGDLASTGFYANLNAGKFQFVPLGVAVIDYTWNPNANQWYQIEISRSGSTLKLFIDGTEVSSVSNSDNITGATGNLEIGRLTDGNRSLNGWLDEFRIIKGRALHTSSFSPPTAAYTNPSNPSEYEYHLYVNTDNILTFRLSNTGTAADVTVRATSFGALTTATWYNAVAYHSAGSNLAAVGINLSMNSSAYTGGVRSGSAPFIIGAISNATAGLFDGRIDEVMFSKKFYDTQDRILIYNSGNANTWQTSFGTDPWASFDFGSGSNNNRWLTVAAGTGIYASSNLGITFVTIATDRTANYQYFERSKNILVSGSDSYDTPLYWAGSAGTFMAILNASAPLAKYWINHLGFLIGLNNSTRKRSFFWEDENTQLTGDWADSFDIPSSTDDEITNGFILRRRLYCSTRYFTYGVDYIGGNPDWQFRKIKDFGFVPRTVKIMQIEGVGEVAIGMDWGNKLRIFDGDGDKIISSNIEFDNGICDFALYKVSNSGSGKIVSFAEVEKNESIYRLCVAIGENSTKTTHFINFNRNQAFYPDDNRPFNTMCSAESNNTQYTMAFDRSGRCHMLDSGNKDAGITPIQDVLALNYLYDKSPSQAQKNHGLDLYFINNTAGRIYIKESVNFDKTFTDRDSFVISGTGNKTLFHKSIDVLNETNSYQPMITTSGGTSDPWRLIRYDFFTEGMGIGKTE